MFKTITSLLLAAMLSTAAVAQTGEQMPVCELLFAADVSTDTFKALEKEWHEVCSPDQPVNMTITSSGGDPDTGAAMHDWIKAKGWNTTASGKVYSAAVSVFLAGKDRYITPHSLVLIHPGAMYLDNKMTDLEMAEMLQMDHQQDIIYNQIISTATGLPIETVDQMVRAHTFFTAEQAVQNGFAHSMQ